MREQKIPELDSARALMTEAMTWSVIRWLREKERVRTSANQTNAVLDVLSEKVRGQWPLPLREQYQALCSGNSNGKAHPPKQPAKPDPSSGLRSDAIALKLADDCVHRARMDAEATFDEAEKKLSTALAREGCKKAIRAWDLHEQAIQRAKQFIVSK